MKHPTICEVNISELPDSSSPFSRLIALDYFDGPLSGVVQCRTCPQVYKFKMLDWNDDWTIRIFGLTRSPSEVFAQIEEMFSRYDRPRWPSWVPHWDDIATVSRESVYQVAERLVQDAGSIEFVIAARDPTEKILAVKIVDDTVVDSIGDWFAFLGMQRSATSRK